MNRGGEIRSAIAIGLGAVLVLASMNLFTSQASATVKDRIFRCPDGSDGPPCGPNGDTRIFRCPDGSDGPPCGPPGRMDTKN